MLTYPKVCSHSLRHSGEHAQFRNEGQGLQNVLLALGRFLGSGQQERLLHVVDLDSVLVPVIVYIRHLSSPLDVECAHRARIPVYVAYLVGAVVVPEAILHIT